MQIYKFNNQYFRSLENKFGYNNLLYDLDLISKYVLVMNSRELSIKNNYTLVSDLPIEIISENNIYKGIYNFELNYIIIDYLPYRLRGVYKLSNIKSSNEVKEIGFYTKSIFKNNNRFVNNVLYLYNPSLNKDIEYIKYILLLLCCLQIVKFNFIKDFNVVNNIIKDFSLSEINDNLKQNYFNYIIKCIKQSLSIIKL